MTNFKIIAERISFVIYCSLNSDEMHMESDRLPEFSEKPWL
jgi:hypothetical protein